MDIYPNTWPSDTECEAGATCNVTGVAETLPAHLSVETPGTPDANSGEDMTIGCSDAALSLSLAFHPMSYECYNGDFLELPDVADYPPAGECIEALACTDASIVSMGIPSYMERTSMGSVAHADMIEFECSNGKFLDPSVDTDGDNIFSVQCNNGVAKTPFEFPTEDMCKAKCTSITLPPASAFDVPVSISSFEGEKLAISCTDGTQYVNADSWISQTYAFECQDTGEFLIPDPVPACGVRPECGPPDPTPVATKLLADFPTDNTPAGLKTSFTCENTDWVTDVGKILLSFAKRLNCTFSNEVGRY